ncbi:MAG: metal ABC transporter substrate-binding protein [Treponema sp.]|jgi:zinc transport system substrate-binding protein|nr:metal ABC transporter substrate-binding protein [Treponema sp.]
MKKTCRAVFSAAHIAPHTAALSALVAAFAAVLVTMGFSGCARKSDARNAGARGTDAGASAVSVTATIFAPYDFVRQLAGGKAALTMLLPPGAESHSFEPTPQDMITVQKSAVFIYVGGESDTWVERILASLDTSGMQIVSLMDCVEVVEEELVEGMEEEAEEEEAEGPEYDEHVWTSPRNAARIAAKIADALCAADAENAALYRQNAAAYIARLEALDQAFIAVTQNAPRKTIVFGDRFPFRYLADAYGLSYYAAFPGCSTETECSAATIAFLINTIKRDHIPVVFHIELSNEKIADTIAEETGAKKRLLHACHNISKEDFNAGKTYLELMEMNVERLHEALGDG